MTSNMTAIQPVEFKIVPADQRLEALQTAFPNMYLIFEQLVCRYLENFIDSFTVGYLEYYELENGGFYISILSSAEFDVSIPMARYKGVMSGEALSIVANMFAMAYLANDLFSTNPNDVMSDHCCEMYYRLERFSSTHVYADEILKATKFLV